MDKQPTSLKPVVPAVGEFVYSDSDNTKGWAGYSDSLRDGRPGDRIPVKGDFLAPVWASPGSHPASYTTGIGSFRG